MRMPKSLLIALFIATSVATSAEPPERPARVSMIQLIADPERYEGKLVTLTAYVHLEFEGDAVWLHQDDFENGIYANSLWLSNARCKDSNGEPMSGYASLAGRFTATRHGHMGLWPGTLTQLGECFPVPSKAAHAD